MPPIDATSGAMPVNTQPSATSPTPSADLDGNGYLDAYEQQQAATRFAPVLYFAPDEQHFPADPPTFIQESSLRRERDPGEEWSWTDPGVALGQDEELHGEGDVPIDALLEVGPDNATADDQVFLDHADSDEARAGDIGDAPMLYQYDAVTNTLTYHVFYAYNDGPPGRIGDQQNHEGDWERITIQLDDQFRPTEVRYSAHSGLDVSRAWPGADNPDGQPPAPLENGKPVVFVGQGSHANFPETGRWATEFGPVQDLAVYVPGSSVRLDLATLEARDVTAEPWYGSHVMWGERGSSSEIPGGTPIIGGASGMTSGPTGPLPDGDDADAIPDKGPLIDADPREPVS